MSKSDKHLGQLVNRLRTAANVLGKEAAAAKSAPAEFPGWENTPAGQAQAANVQMLEFKAEFLRGVAVAIDDWLKRGGFMTGQSETNRGLIAIQPSPEALRAALADLLSAADAVIGRWHTPLWKDARPTAEYIAALRLAAESARKLLVGDK